MVQLTVKLKAVDGEGCFMTHTLCRFFNFRLLSVLLLLPRISSVRSRGDEVVATRPLNNVASVPRKEKRAKPQNQPSRRRAAWQEAATVDSVSQHVLIILSGVVWELLILPPDCLIRTGDAASLYCGPDAGICVWRLLVALVPFQGLAWFLFTHICLRRPALAPTGVKSHRAYKRSSECQIWLIYPSLISDLGGFVLSYAAFFLQMKLIWKI